MTNTYKNMDPVKAKEKAIRLFTYLEKALSLNDQVVRDFRSSIIQSSIWWLADYPHDLDSLFIKNFHDENGDIDSELEDNMTLLRVQKKDIEKCPKLPDQLSEWISEINPIEIKAIDKIDRKTYFNDNNKLVESFKIFRKNFEEGNVVPEDLNGWVVLKPGEMPSFLEYQYVSDSWSDHPELQKLLNDYKENEWNKWSDRVIKIFKANSLYDQLYALRLILKNEGDSHELLLGHGLLSWFTKTIGNIYSPIFLTPLILDFDASKRVIEIKVDPIFKSFVEISPVSEMDNPAETDLDRWMNIVNSNSFDFWHFETLKTQANTFLNYLSPNSENSFDKKIISNPSISENPSIWNAPVIFLRKRNNSLWSKYSEKIKIEIEQNDSVPTDFINDLVGEYSDDSVVNNSDNETNIKTYKINDSELFFPLPWNEEQKRIAERMDFNYGMVVKGPPGTGKSHTIANLISRFLAQGKSVLVTSQTSKALEVLREKLPINIRSLAVSQLNQSAKQDDVLQQSISEISSNLGERNTRFSESEAEIVRRMLGSLREEKAIVSNLIKRCILIDSTEKITIDNEIITPIDASKIIDQYKDDASTFWFNDVIDFNSELNFSFEDIFELNKILLELKGDDRNLCDIDLLDVSLLPNSDFVLGSFDSYNELILNIKALNDFNSDFVISKNEDDLFSISSILDEASKVLLFIDEDYKKEIFNLCVASKGEYDKWNTIFIKILDKIKSISDYRNKNIGHSISGNLEVSLYDLIDAVDVLKKKVSVDSKIGAVGRMFLPLNSKKILDNYLVDGRCPDSVERIDILNNDINIKLIESEIKILLKDGFLSLKNPPILSEKLDIIQLEVLITNTKKIVDYCVNFLDIDKFFKDVPVLSQLVFTCYEDLAKAKKFISLALTKIELLKIEELFINWINLISEKTSEKSHVTNNNFLLAIKNRNFDLWKKSLNDLFVAVENKNKSLKLKDISNRIQEYAPNLYKKIVEISNISDEVAFPDNLELVCKLSRLRFWIDSIHNHISIDDLQKKYERLSKQEFQLNSDLVTILAWQRQIDKVTKRQRDALMAWSDSMKKYGKGTGKYAHKHLSAAQESLSEAKNAVPVWIMPLHRVAQMFSNPKAGMFDVVIFDEASQCDIRGISVGYLGKKLLVVGDPDQISPAGMFQDQERIYELISRFLNDIPHKDNFSITSSLFDLAKIRIPNMIQLNEHFRCVPEIIAFSNYNVYDGKLKPLRHPHPKGLLEPALCPVFVDGGYQNTNNKVNEPEANAIVSKIVECLDDPKYQHRPDGRLCTFGVISLLAEDQAKYIKELLLKHPKVGERVIEERNIVCGDAYAFQGDERDVIFLSMVKALDPNNLNDTVRSLTDKGTAQRFNVAATRGRDQVFLYHSIPLSEFKNQDDWRYKILNWYYNPKTEELDAGRDALKNEFDSGRASQFSFDVGNLLINKGYKVIPEYPVIGYRIDLVIQGDNSRLAVECDGDQYHTLENLEADQFREMQLRRAGWEFWRLSGSSFYRYKEKALDSLWLKLDELDIKPIV